MNTVAFFFQVILSERCAVAYFRELEGGYEKSFDKRALYPPGQRRTGSRQTVATSKNSFQGRFCVKTMGFPPSRIRTWQYSLSLFLDFGPVSLLLQPLKNHYGNYSRYALRTDHQVDGSLYSVIEFGQNKTARAAARCGGQTERGGQQPHHRNDLNSGKPSSRFGWKKALPVPL